MYESLLGLLAKTWVTIFFIRGCPLTGIFVSRGKITDRIRKIGKKILSLSILSAPAMTSFL